MDVSDRRMQVQLTRKFCLRQNLSPRATGFVDPEGLGKSTCRKQKSFLIFLYIFFIYQSDFCGCGLCQRSERPGDGRGALQQGGGAGSDPMSAALSVGCCHIHAVMSRIK